MQNNLSEQLRVMRTAAWIWITYLACLAVIDLAIYSNKPGGSILSYHAINALPSMLFLGLAYSKWLKNSAGFVTAIMILLISIAPILLNQVFNLKLPPAPLSNTEGMALRQLPILMIGLVLVAWQYPRTVMVLYSIAANLFELAVVFALNRMDDPKFVSFYFIIVIRMVCLIVVGVFISQLINSLRVKQESLEAANRQLAHQASTLESLTISRERNRMSRELHDTVVHTLSGLAVQFETIQAYWDIDSETSRRLLGQAQETAHSGLNETRRALKALRASPLEDLGLVLALQRLSESAAERGKLILDISLPDREVYLPPDVEQALYRILQEALDNIVHHANAKRLVVQLTIEKDRLRMLVRDDGQGFNPEDGFPAGHFGIQGMGERAQLVGGVLKIISQPKGGSSLELVIEGIRV